MQAREPGAGVETTDPERRALWLRHLGDPRRVARAVREGREPPAAPGWQRELEQRGLTAWIPPAASGWPVLLVRGREPSAQGVAVVGTRAADPYGLACARRLGQDVAALGLPLVSGGAEGCDAAAHVGALEAGGETVVVIGSGHDHPYPRAHRPLFERIVAGGGSIVSPFWPTVRPARYRFLLRNRVIAGLSRVVIVARAPRQSGALSTARAATELGRGLLAVPGNVGEGLSEGGNRLLSDGAARAVAGPGDLARALGLAPSPAAGGWPRRHLGDPSPWPASETQQPGESQLEPDAAAVLDYIERYGPLDLEALLVQTGLPVDALVGVVTELEVGRLIERVAGQQYRVRVA